VAKEEMVEFENPLNGELSLIKAAEVKEWEVKREQLRLRLLAGRLSAPSHLARVVEDPEDWINFAIFIIRRDH